MQPLDISPPDSQFTFPERDEGLINGNHKQQILNALKKCIAIREKKYPPLNKSKLCHSLENRTN